MHVCLPIRRCSVCSLTWKPKATSPSSCRDPRGVILGAAGNHEFSVPSADIDQNRRLEGVSDPADLVIVFSLHCPIYDAAGTLVLHYGPDASAEESDALAAAAADCRNCDLYVNATQTVFGAGPAVARMMLVGEQPGDKEDLARAGARDRRSPPRRPARGGCRAGNARLRPPADEVSR
jgi:hypothetical protein